MTYNEGNALEEFNRVFTNGSYEGDANVRQCVSNIKKIADEQPYYKYNLIWSRHIETLSFCVVFYRWLGGDGGEEGKLCTYEEVAKFIGGIIFFLIR